MNVRINGAHESIEISSNIAELIFEKGLSPDKVVVEHNFKIVSKNDWALTHLREGDRIEIVSFVGGG